MVFRELHRWVLALCLPVAFFVGCDDDGGDETGDVDAGDVTPDEAADIEAEETGQEIDEALVGLYSFVSATGESGTITPDWQSAPAAGSPDREVRMTGAITTRSDGTYTRILKLLERDGPGGEAEVVDEDASALFTGTWYVEDGHLFGQDDDETEPDEWTYDFNESTGLLTLDNVAPVDDEAAQMVWQRETIDTDLIATWDLVSVELADLPDPITTENQEISTPEGTFNIRVSGLLAFDADGFFSREFLVWVDDSEADDLNADGLAYRQNGILVTEEPEEDHEEWEYTVDTDAGLFSQRPYGMSGDLVEIVWELREE